MYLEKNSFAPDEIMVYLRKSRSDDPMMSVEEVLKKHEIILNEWAMNNIGSPVPDENYFREVVSGETISGRPQIKRMLHLAESDRYKAILVVDVQRLSRGDLEDCGRLINLLRYTKTAVITPFRAFDLNDKFDRDGFEMELKQGNQYLEYSKMIMNRGKELSIRSGNFIFGKAPYGYRRTTVMDGRRKCPTLEIIEEEARVVRMIFDLYVNERIGSTAIANRLNAMGFRTRNGNIWKKSTIDKMIYNPTYIGKVTIGKVTKSKVVENMEIKVVSHRDLDCETVDGKHEAIIDEDTFYRVRSLRNSRPKVKVSKELQNPLAGLMFCERCGYAMSRRKMRGTYRYHCDNQTRCRNVGSNEEDVIDALCDALKSEIRNFEVKDDSVQANEINIHRDYVESLRKRIEEIGRNEESAWEKYTEENMPKAIFDKLIKKYADERKMAESELHKAERNAPDSRSYGEIITSLHESIDMIKDDSVSAKAKNDFLRTIIDRIEYEKSPSRWEDEDFSQGEKCNMRKRTNGLSLSVRLKV